MNYQMLYRLRYWKLREQLDIVAYDAAVVDWEIEKEVADKFGGFAGFHSNREVYKHHLQLKCLKEGRGNHLVRLQIAKDNAIIRIVAKEWGLFENPWVGMGCYRSQWSLTWEQNGQYGD